MFNHSNKNYNFFYFLTVFMIVSLSILSDSLNQYQDSINNIILFTTVYLSFILFLHGNFDFKSSIRMVLMSVVALSLVVVSTRFNFGYLLLLLLMMFNGQFIEEKKLSKVVFFSGIMTILIIVLLYIFFGFNRNHDYLGYRMYSNSWVFRRSLGFIQPNSVTKHWLVVVICFLLSNFKNKVHYFLLFIVSCLIFYLTNSRTGFCLILLAFLLNFLFKNKLNMAPNRFITFLLSVTPFIFTFSCIILAYNYNINNNWINILLSGRIGIYYKYFNMFHVTLLGDVNVQAYSHVVPFDNGYIYILLSKGIIYYTLFFGFIFIALNKTRKKLNWQELISFFIYLLYGVVETTFNTFDLSFILVIIGIKVFRVSELSRGALTPFKVLYNK